MIHPKSDVQRKSLLEAVKNILLFRSLEPHQLGEVLDAMFYREVEPGDYIIHAGDDGDNFYVIERSVSIILLLISQYVLHRHYLKYIAASMTSSSAPARQRKRLATTTTLAASASWHSCTTCLVLPRYR